MHHFCKLALITLLSSLLLSILFNIVLFNNTVQYYKSLNATRLDPLGLNAYPSVTLTYSQPTVVFFGDSRAADWPNPNVPSFNFLNRGIGAQTSSQVYWRLTDDIQPLSPHILILQVGINDLKTIPLFPLQKKEIIANCRQNITKIISQAVTAKTIVILTTIFPVDNAPLERELFWSPEVAQAIIEVNDDLKTLRHDQVIIFDAYAILVKDGLIRPEYAEDLLHLNANGYAALNRGLQPILEQLAVK